MVLGALWDPEPVAPSGLRSRILWSRPILSLEEALEEVTGWGSTGSDSDKYALRPSWRKGNATSDSLTLWGDRKSISSMRSGHRLIFFFDRISNLQPSKRQFSRSRTTTQGTSKRTTKVRLVTGFPSVRLDAVVSLTCDISFLNTWRLNFGKLQITGRLSLHRWLDLLNQCGLSFFCLPVFSIWCHPASQMYAASKYECCP